MTRKTQKTLVESYARTWPREMIRFLNDRKARQNPDASKAAAMLEKPGVYVLFKGETPHYAGKATNLRKRLVTHMRLGARYANSWDNVSLFFIDDASHRTAVESIVVASIGAAANSAKPKIRKIPMPARAFSKWQRQIGKS